MGVRSLHEASDMTADIAANNAQDESHVVRTEDTHVNHVPLTSHLLELMLNIETDNSRS